MKLNVMRVMKIGFSPFDIGTGSTNCQTNGTHYEGRLNVTFNGFLCLKWTLVRGDERLDYKYSLQLCSKSLFVVFDLFR